jgi:rRNA-processing protein FCF1
LRVNSSRAIPDAVVKALEALKPEERTDASVVQFVIADVVNDALRAMSTEGVNHVEEAA